MTDLSYFLDQFKYVVFALYTLTIGWFAVFAFRRRPPAQNLPGIFFSLVAITCLLALYYQWWASEHGVVANLGYIHLAGAAIVVIGLIVCFVRALRTADRNIKRQLFLMAGLATLCSIAVLSDLALEVIASRSSDNITTQTPPH